MSRGPRPLVLVAYSSWLSEVLVLFASSHGRTPLSLQTPSRRHDRGCGEVLEGIIVKPQLPIISNSVITGTVTERVPDRKLGLRLTTL